VGGPQSKMGSHMASLTIGQSHETQEITSQDEQLAPWAAPTTQILRCNILEVYPS